MKSVLFHIPGLGLNVYSSGFMIAAGCVAALWFATWQGRRRGISPETIQDLALWSLVGGLLGARLYYVVDFWGERIDSWSEILQINDGGLVLHGAFLGGAVALLTRYLLRPFPILRTLDILAPAISLGMAIGRVGCLLHGCCYGIVCVIPRLGLRFPPKSPAWIGQHARGMIPADALATLPTHPTQIYLILEGLILFVFLIRYGRKPRRQGEVFGLFLWIYPISHFVIETFRDDEGPAFRSLSMSQLVSLMILAIASVYWSNLERWQTARLPEPAAPPRG